MNVTRRARPVWRRAGAALLLAVVGGGAAFVPFAGRFLVREDPLERADAIFVLAGTEIERPLEAVDLYKEGYGREILLSPGRAEAAELRIRALGVRYLLGYERTREAMVQLGVPESAVHVVTGAVDNTAEEATLLRTMAGARGWRRVIIVTSKYHSRRSGFAFRRELRGAGITILVRTSRYDLSDPAHWWRSRADVRYVVSELQKWTLYRLGLGGGSGG